MVRLEPVWRKAKWEHIVSYLQQKKPTEAHKLVSVDRISRLNMMVDAEDFYQMEKIHGVIGAYGSTLRMWGNERVNSGLSESNLESHEFIG
ncbi:MAG: hypothetical protein CK427_03390 [Leptospira sp.]|nr:MAG: hypothetical protein CK427_03390 [Leptospira sp.]